MDDGVSSLVKADNVTSWTPLRTAKAGDKISLVRSPNEYCTTGSQQIDYKLLDNYVVQLRDASTQSKDKTAVQIIIKFLLPDIKLNIQSGIAEIHAF